MRRCVHCGAEVGDDDYYCNNCGKESKKAESEIVCDFCGEVIEPGHAFCSTCGADITDDKYRSDSEIQTNHTIVILIIVLVSVIAAFCGYIAWIMNTDDPEKGKHDFSYAQKETFVYSTKITT